MSWTRHAAKAMGKTMEEKENTKEEEKIEADEKSKTRKKGAHR